MALVVVPKYHRLGEGFSNAEIRKGDEHPGRRTDGSQSAASWVSDLVDLRKTVLLCSFCRPHFNPRKHNYRKLYIPDRNLTTGGYAVNGKCDACKKFTFHSGGGTAFIHEEIYALTCIDPVVARRNARAAAKLAWSAGR